MRIVWTGPAISDLQALRAYIGRDRPGTTSQQIEHILAAIGGLVRFPESGRPGRRSGTRELVIGRTPYIVAYRTRGDAIQILRLLHGRQRWPAAF
jgi:toxin ParE1/3/4